MGDTFLRSSSGAEEMVREILNTLLPTYCTRHGQRGPVEFFIDPGHLLQRQASRPLDAHYLDLQQPRIAQLR